MATETDNDGAHRLTEEQYGNIPRNYREWEEVCFMTDALIGAPAGTTFAPCKAPVTAPEETSNYAEVFGEKGDVYITIEDGYIVRLDVSYFDETPSHFATRTSAAHLKRLQHSPWWTVAEGEQGIITACMCTLDNLRPDVPTAKMSDWEQFGLLQTHPDTQAQMSALQHENNAMRSAVVMCYDKGQLMEREIMRLNNVLEQMQLTAQRAVGNEDVEQAKAHLADRLTEIALLKEKLHEANYRLDQKDSKIGYQQKVIRKAAKELGMTTCGLLGTVDQNEETKNSPEGDAKVAELIMELPDRTARSQTRAAQKDGSASLNAIDTHAKNSTEVVAEWAPNSKQRRSSNKAAEEGEESSKTEGLKKRGKAKPKVQDAPFGNSGRRKRKASTGSDSQSEDEKSDDAERTSSSQKPKRKYVRKAPAKTTPLKKAGPSAKAKATPAGMTSPTTSQTMSPQGR